MRSFLLLLCVSLSSAQEWPHYANDPGGSKYSPLSQINRANVSQLKPAWTYHTRDISDGSKYPIRSAFEATPLVIDGVMYFTTPFYRLIALDAETGRELWSFDPKVDLERAANLFVHRGAVYWADGADRRLFYGDMVGRLHAINAATGKPVDSFGKAGYIDLREGMVEPGSTRGYGMTSPPSVYKNLIICGSIVPDGEPQGPLGDVRAFDARTGKLVWRFQTVHHNLWDYDLPAQPVLVTVQRNGKPVVEKPVPAAFGT